jgi:hypothetical protein
MDLHAIVLVNRIKFVDVQSFINEVDDEIPHFLQSFDMVLLCLENVPLSMGWDVIL